MTTATTARARPVTAPVPGSPSRPPPRSSCSPASRWLRDPIPSTARRTAARSRWPIGGRGHDRAPGRRHGRQLGPGPGGVGLIQAGETGRDVLVQGGAGGCGQQPGTEGLEGGQPAVDVGAHVGERVLRVAGLLLAGGRQVRPSPPARSSSRSRRGRRRRVERQRLELSRIVLESSTRRVAQLVLKSRPRCGRRESRRLVAVQRRLERDHLGGGSRRTTGCARWRGRR